MRLFVLVALLPYLVFGGSLQEAILNSLRSNQGAKLCNLCPFNGPTTIPSGSPRTVGSCCSGNFTTCGAGPARCRTLADYVIPENEGPSNNVEICPAVPEEGCTCQTALSAAPNVSLKLCPTPTNCCKTCRCVGDPHCVSFAGTTDSFVVCDVRDASCNFPRQAQLPAACAKAKFNGVQCVVRPDPTGRDFCQVPANLPPPTMDMYNRPYQNATGQTLEFRIDLELSIYGSVSVVHIRDGGKTYDFSIQFKKGKFSCTLPPGIANIASVPSYGPGGFIHLDKLDSGVVITLKCVILKHLWGTRIEVPQLLDDYAPGAPGRGGFCQTGKIPESAGATGTNCTIDKRLLDQFEAFGYTCQGQNTFVTPAPTGSGSNSSDVTGSTTNLCKKLWCAKPLINTGTGINWKAAGFSTLQQCENFVVVVGDNFLRSVCSVAPGISVSQPSQCDSDPDCRACMDNLKDFPEEAALILQPATVPRSGGNTGGSGGNNGGPGPCNIDSLLQIGLEHAQNGDEIPTGGVKILFKAANGTDFELIWEATDQEIADYVAACGCVDWLRQSSDILFTAAGTYQIQQCFPEDQFIPNNCYAAPQYLVNVDYPATPVSADLSQPYGDLVSRKQLVCSDPRCPANSQCCIWPHGGPGWLNCMGSQASQFPDCGLGN